MQQVHIWARLPPSGKHEERSLKFHERSVPDCALHSCVIRAIDFVLTPCVLLAVLCVAMSARSAQGQCTPQWSAFGGIPGVTTNTFNTSVVYATANWDPDGSGPLAPRIVAAGSNITIAGTAYVNNIAVFDGTSWAPLGPGLNGQVLALASLPNEELVAGGSFTVGGVTNIARWNGSAWMPLGSGITGTVQALAVLPSGDLVIGGAISSAGGIPVNNIARWNGTSWAALGAGVGNVNSLVRALAVLPNGSLACGGYFTSAGGSPANGVALWSGSAWSALGSGVPPSGNVYSVAALPNNDVLIGGIFSTAGGVTVNNIARWNGAAWVALGSGTAATNAATVNAIQPMPNGDVIIAGDFTSAGGVQAKYVARWDGGAWHDVGAPMTVTSNSPSGLSLTLLPGGDVVAAGVFRTIGGVGAYNIARWDGTSWHSLGSGMNDKVRAIAALAGGDIIVGGDFVSADSSSPNHVARLSGSTLSSLGAGIGGSVLALLPLANGDVIAGGSFTTAGGVSAQNIARWNGSAWSPLGSGVAGVVNSIALHPGGDLIVSLGSSVVRWNGTGWTALASVINGGAVEAVAAMPNGDIVIGGTFFEVGEVSANYIARWNGSNWQQLGGGVSATGSGAGVHALAVLPSGDLIVGGWFSHAGSVASPATARWNGAAWQAMPGIAGPVYALKALQSGDIFAAGSFGAPNVRRWDGTTWQNVSATGPTTILTCLESGPGGDLFVGGSLLSLSNPASIGQFARLGCPPCYANCDNSSVAPVLNANDFQCFLNKFAAADSSANCDESSTPPVLNANDFQCFLNRFAAGCG